MADPAVAASRCRLCGHGMLQPLEQVRGFTFVECPTCRFVFAPGITRAWMEALYRDGYHGPAEGAPEVGWADASILEPAFDRLRRARPLDILDFGAGQSVLPDLLRSQGHRVVAVDAAPPLQPYPDRLTGDLLDLRLAAGRFDLVHACQVFEHLPEPRPVLEELLRLTRPEGLVLVHTDMHTPEREAASFADWWYVSPPDHCAFFRHRTFKVFLRGSPHRLVYRDPKSVVIQVRAC